MNSLVGYHPLRLVAKGFIEKDFTFWMGEYRKTEMTCQDNLSFRVRTRRASRCLFYCKYFVLSDSKKHLTAGLMSSTKDNHPLETNRARRFETASAFAGPPDREVASKLQEVPGIPIN